MSNYVSGPTTFEQIRWAATTFRGQSDDADYIPLGAAEFRRTLLDGPDAASVERLLRFVNRWGFPHFLRQSARHCCRHRPGRSASPAAGCIRPGIRRPALRDAGHH